MNQKYSYNTLSFLMFTVLIIGTLSFFALADDTTLSLFEDFDRDGLSNAEEKTLGTDAKVADTDGDGYSDGVEVESGYNPLIPAPGDRIVTPKKTAKLIPPTQVDTTNVTEQITIDFVSSLADMQETGTEELSPEDFSNMISEAVNKEVVFPDKPTADFSNITIKKQDYDSLSKKKREEKMREDALNYLTAVSYIFMSTFPQGFFEQPVDTIQATLMEELSDVQGNSSSKYTYFENIAKDALTARDQLSIIDVPEEMLRIHKNGLYLLEYINDIYTRGDYKKIDSDVATGLVSFIQVYKLLSLGLEFKDQVNQKLEQYDFTEILLDY